MATRSNERLCLRYQRGDERAAEELLARNQRLIYKLAARYRPASAGMDEEDILQDGRLGLLEAALKFDPTRGTKFSTMAVWWIRQAMGRGMERAGMTIRLPAHVHGQINKARAAGEKEPEVGVVARSLDEEVHGSNKTGVGQTVLLSDFIPDPTDYEARQIDAEFIREALGTLPDLEREVVERRYLDGDSLAQIGRVFGRSKEWARLVLVAATRKLRAFAKED